MRCPHFAASELYLHKVAMTLADIVIEERRDNINNYQVLYRIILYYNIKLLCYIISYHIILLIIRCLCQRTFV